jgi:hypothetical protein
MDSLAAYDSPHHHHWLKVTTPLTLRTKASPPTRNMEALVLSSVHDKDDDTLPSTDLITHINICFKAHKRTTRLLLKHARNLRRLNYGKALLRRFFKKPRMALQSIFRTTPEEANTQPLPTDLSII